MMLDSTVSEISNGDKTDTRKSSVNKQRKKSSVLVWKEKGNAAFKEKKYSEAVHCYSEAIALAPHDVIFYCRRTEALIELSEHKAALKDCETLLKLRKDYNTVYIYKGIALMGLKRYDEAIDSFDKVKKTRTNEKIIAEYMKEVERHKQLVGEISCEIESLISSLGKGSLLDIWKGNYVIVKLKERIVEKTHQTLFRTCKGFNIFSEHPAFNRLLKKTCLSPEESKVLVNIIGLLSNVLNGSEENSNIVCSMDYLVNSSIDCLKMATSLKEAFETIQFFHRISQFESSRKILLTSTSISELIDQTLVIMDKGGDLALISIGIINNLALDAQFVPKFEKMLWSDFIPRVIKITELLSHLHPDESVRSMISKSKALPSLLKCLTSTDENVIGNAALVFADCHETKLVVNEAVDCGLMQKLFRLVINDKLSNNVRSNCAVTIALYCLVERKCLQQVADLDGLEVVRRTLESQYGPILGKKITWSGKRKQIDLLFHPVGSQS